mgnify:CR=1 FL=1
MPGIIASTINVIGNRLVKSIKDNIKSGRDVNGSSFEQLKDSTKALGGKKPLFRSGKMIKGIKKTPAKTGDDPKFVLEMTTKSSKSGRKKSEVYGVFHNMGYKNPSDSWFPNAEVPQRKWFGVTKEMKPGGTEFKEAIKEIHKRVVSAWRK